MIMTNVISRVTFRIFAMSKYLACFGVEIKSIMYFIYMGGLLYSRIVIYIWMQMQYRLEGNTVITYVAYMSIGVKGSLTRDFRLQVFFMNQCPPGPQVFHWGHNEFFRKFAEIFANEYFSPV
jgi:hypothetical protein